MLSLVAALLLAPPSELGPTDLGRAFYFTGVCRQLGFVARAEDSDRIARTFAAAYPGGASTAFADQAQAGVDAGMHEFIGLTAVFAGDRDLPAFRSAVMSRCNGVIRDFPGMMSRTPSTDAEFEAATAELLGPDAPAGSKP